MDDLFIKNTYLNKNRIKIGDNFEFTTTLQVFI